MRLHCVIGKRGISMKIRADFVTNSSSSSFIVAKRNDCTREDVEALLKDRVQEFIKSDAEYCYDYEEMVEQHGKRKATKLMADKIIDGIYDMGSMKLDNWTAESVEASSDGGLLEAFIYNKGYVDGEKLKIGG